MPSTRKKDRDEGDLKARARLRRKVLERWENEGGKIVDTTVAVEPRPRGRKRPPGGKK
jgi:hypothetical protein